MTTEEKLASLAQSLSATPSRSPDEVEGDSVNDVREEPTSATCLKLDRWSVRRGKEWLDDPEMENVFDRDCQDLDAVAADMLAVAWEPSPRLAENPRDQRRARFIAAMIDSPEYQRLHRDTQLNAVASEIAAVSFARNWFALSSKDEPEDELDRDGEIMEHVGKSVKNAAKDVGNLKEACVSIGQGSETGAAGDMSVDDIKRMFDKVKNNSSLRRIMEQAGRYRRLAQSLQRAKPIHGNDELVGVKLDGDIENIMDCEFAMLCDEDLENDFISRWLEDSLMCQEKKAEVSETAGPIVIVVDESGSMRGDPIAHAKAMALAILWVAEHQKRWACLVGFSSFGEGNFLTIEPGKRDTGLLMDWLCHFFGNGTSMSVPLMDVPSRWEELGCPEGKTDIILITDCSVDVPREYEDYFLDWKRRHSVKMSTIVIEDDPGDIAKVSDKFWKIDSLGLDSDGVSECLSV